MTVTSHEIDFIRAGPGDDTIIFSRTSWAFVVPGPGDDLIRGPALRGKHGTCVSLYAAAGPVRIDLVRGRATGQGRDRFPPTPGDDDVSSGWSILEGLPPVDQADRMYLGPGDDTGDGGPGPDRLYGGPGSDEINGGPGSDYLDGGPGNDYLHSGYGCLDTGLSSDEPPPILSEVLIDAAPNEVFGRSGDDFLAGDLGNDRLDGGLGFDSGTGGYHDGRIDWITSVEHHDECNSP